MTLPFTVEFHSDEVPVSLASRLAAANGYASLKQFLAHVGLKAQAISEGEPAAIDHLSQLSGIAAADIGRFSLKRISHMLSSFGGTNIRTPPKLAASHRLCPHCVVEDLANGGEKPSTRPYVRYQWFASGIHHCLVHGNALLNLDAGDFQYDFAGFVDRYYDEIAARADLKSPVKATPADIYASERLARKQTNAFLDSLELYVAMDLFQVLGSFLDRRCEPSIDRKAADRGFSAAAGGPRAIEAAVVGAITHSRPITHNVQSFFGPLLTWLRANRKRPEFVRVVDLFQDIAVRNLPLGTDDVFVMPVKRRVIDSVSSASKRCGLTERRVREIVLREGLAPHALKQSQHLWFNMRLAEPHLKAAKEALTDLEAAALLGISATLIRYFRQSDIFSSHLGQRMNLNGVQLQRQDVETLLDALFRGTPVVKGAVGLSSLAQAAAKTNCTFEEVVRLAKSRALPSLCAVPGTRILKDLLVDVSEVRAAVRAAREKRGY